MKITNDNLLDIIAEASYKLHREIKRAYRNGNLDGYLSSIGMLDLLPPEDDSIYDTDPEGKVLIIGEAKIKEHQIYGCLKEYGIAKERVELHMGYERSKNFRFQNIRYNPNYRLILFGPVPHSGEGKAEKSSIITQIEDTDGYPKVIRLKDANGLKITKTSLKNAISREINSGYLVI
ncbi:MAG: hypothetical protein PHV61_05515 [Limnochordia bacterium]|nr:hypothetical protein [Limnochordia bacterium]MDD4518298.1 hypothetical protein [Limnochordia bacterium]